jgi:hypothetical protein
MRSPELYLGRVIAPPAHAGHTLALTPNSGHDEGEANCQRPDVSFLATITCASRVATSNNR